MGVSAAIAVGGSIIGGHMASQGAQDAADTMSDASNYAANLQNEQWQQTRQDLAPWRDAGRNALSQMTGFQAPNLNASNFVASPDYAFRLKQGEDAILSGANAGGMRLSGRTLKALSDYGQASGMQEFNNWYARRMGESQDQWNRLSALAGFGTGANSLSSQAGQAATAGISNSMMQGAQAQAAAQTQQANMWGNLVNSGIGAWGMYNMGRR